MEKKSKWKKKKIICKLDFAIKSKSVSVCVKAITLNLGLLTITERVLKCHGIGVVI